MGLGFSLLKVLFFVRNGSYTSQTDTSQQTPSSPNSTTTNVNVYVDEDQPQPWIGPGGYYGFWFVNSYDDDGWYRRHWHGRHHNDQHHGHFRGHHSGDHHK